MKMRAALLGAALIAACCQFPAFADEPQPFMIKESKPSLGANIRQNIVKAGYIPLDKKYEELTPEQQKMLKAQYEKMSDQDEPPFPLEGLKQAYVAAGMVHEQLDMKYRGQLTMYVEVDSAGNAKSVSVETSPDPEITKQVANVLMVQKYKPARCNGSPCAQVFPFNAELIGKETWELRSGNPATPGVFMTPYTK